MLPVLLLGLVLGFRHAFEPDHLAAVSTLASRRGCATRAGAGTCASTCTKRTRIHLHSHAQDAGHAHLHTADARRSLGFGVAHGLAGSGAIAVLLVVGVAHPRRHGAGGVTARGDVGEGPAPGL